jgi:dTDP-4-dehydrorhamnose 3,5-epimerase
MEVVKTELSGVFVINPKVFKDDRGFFFESYQYEKLRKEGVDIVFRQDNQSFSKEGTIRGLHYQKGSAAQTKLVRCLQGEIYDVIVDLRRASPTFGRWLGVVLSAENKKQLFIPQGFAHGFSVLSAQAEVFYKCDNYYSPQDEAGIRWNDPTLAIAWQVSMPCVSPKDNKLPYLKDVKPQDLF